MFIAFSLLLLTMVLFANDRLRLDLVALLAILALILTGLLTPTEALAGFSDPIVLIIAGLFVVGGGLFQTGVADAMGYWLSKIAGNNPLILLVTIMGAVAVLSAFMTSTGAVAIFLPVVVNMAWRAKISPSKLLLPLAYGSLIGGMLTLIGTPPNIVASNQLTIHGLPPFGFFTFTPVGLFMLAIGIGFMALFGRRLLPEREQRATGQVRPPNEAAEAPTSQELLNAYALPGKLFRMRVRSTSPLIGATLAEAELNTRYQITVLELQTWPEREGLPLPAVPVAPQTVIEAHTILHVRGAPQDVARLAREQDFGILPDTSNDAQLLSKEIGIAEALLTPRSRLINHTLKQVHFRDKYGVTVLGIQRLGTPLTENLGDTTLRFGDTLLVQGPWEKIHLLREENRDFVVVGESREMLEAQRTYERAPIAIAVMLGMLLLMVFDVMEGVTAVLLAAAAMILSGCLTVEDAHRSMNWESVILMAGMLPLATALQKTGGITFIAELLSASLGSWGPLAILAGLFVLTSTFSLFISNTATTVVMAPIAYQAATALGVAPQALIMAVAMAASTCFASPIGSSSNTLVLGPGGYRFEDYVRIGLPLQLLMLLGALLLLPLLFPF